MYAPCKYDRLMVKFENEGVRFVIAQHTSEVEAKTTLKGLKAWLKRNRKEMFYNVKRSGTDVIVSFV